MRKMILIIGLVLSIGLLMAGCAPQPTTEETVDKAGPEDVVKEEEPVEAETDEKPEGAEEVSPEPSETTETVEPEEEDTAVDTPTTEPEPAKPTTTLTQEDLDKLKESIEGIETEDLGGIAE